MKKTIKQEKKLFLKKLQIMKISDMKVINGGYAAFEGNDDPITKPKTNGGGL
ncbi:MULTISPECIES: hypothetical protein [Chryseobacterium]|uniref:Bacteriocin-like protein n=1 Tax=Chryseobacterium geocarposphaerae TaxID=1416776 RepID=A0ABU1LI81_9FLAO|nr:MULTISPECIES: hypothetical protein [Chryseobacterium]MDR6406436.1 hypothetical protein [Chryseobacterium geocarposphaerae]MDR6699872.1 hypothetical protein [Chryseobacterium ginsenosidimutans]